MMNIVCTNYAVSETVFLMNVQNSFTWSFFTRSEENPIATIAEATLIVLSTEKCLFKDDRHGFDCH